MTRYEILPNKNRTLFLSVYLLIQELIIVC